MLNAIDISKANSRVARYQQNKRIYYQHIKEAQDVKSHAQWTDQFLVEVYMMKPEPRKKLDSNLINSFSLTYDGLDAENLPFGSGSINIFGDMTPLKLDIVFEEEATWENLYKYFFLDNTYEPIIPRDGTYLLPKDWYFEITVHSMDASWKYKQLYKNDFIIDGGLQKDFNTEGGQMQEITLSFVPINSNKQVIDKIKPLDENQGDKNLWDKLTGLLF